MPFCHQKLGLFKKSGSFSKVGKIVDVINIFFSKNAFLTKLECRKYRGGRRVSCYTYSGECRCGWGLHITSNYNMLVFCPPPPPQKKKNWVLFKVFAFSVRNRWSFWIFWKFGYFLWVTRSSTLLLKLDC